MKLAIIEAIGLAAMFIIAAAVSYNSGYVGGGVDEAAERSFGLAAKERDGREAPSSKHPFSNRLRGSLRSGDTDGTGEEVAK